MKFALVASAAAALATAAPLLAPELAQAAPAAAPAAGPALPAFAPSDWKRIDPSNLLVIDTTKGRIVVELVPEIAPTHVARIKELAHQGYYDGLKFFRVVDEFMAQTGDKANTGAGQSGIAPLKGEFNFRRGPKDAFAGAPNGRGGEFGFVGPVPVNSQPDELMGLTADGKVKAWGTFCPGVAGMARTNDPDSASTQFFLMRQAYPSLDDRYTPWGRVVVGLDVVRALNVGEPPADPDVMTRVRLASDLPPADQPKVWRVDPASAAFRARMVAAVQAGGPDFTSCDIEVPVEVRK
jgi:peptidylprolyl isomerase